MSPGWGQISQSSVLDRAIAALAVKQQGNVSRGQLLTLGLGAKAIAYRVKKGWLYTEFPGVYGVGRPARTPIERASAAVLACGPLAALSHGSALTLWGVDRRWHTPFEIIVMKDRRPTGIRTHRPTTIHRRDITVQLGIRTTTLARALLDLAPRLSERVLRRAVNDALHSRFMTNSQLADVIERSPTHRGSPLLSPLLAETSTGVTRSELEDMFKQLCADYGLPTPLTNVELDGFIVDAYFPEHGLVVELDGWEFHRGRISFQDNRDRDADLLAAGTVTTRLTDERIRRDPAKEAARLQRILDRLDGKGPPSTTRAPA